MASGLARAGSPEAETWYAAAHDFSTESCEVGSVSVCTPASSTKYECIMSRIAEGGQGAWAYVIRNESDESTSDICEGFEFCAFGAVKISSTVEEHFYCKWDGDDYDVISLIGTSQNDELFFHHTQNGEFDLQEHGGVSSLDGEILGLSGADNIHGSRHHLNAYKDWLYGAAGSDVIWGHEGNDRIFSGQDSEQIWAGPGNDIINLEGGTNRVSGEDGNDTVQGGPGQDFIHGGDDDDVLYGHEGDDVICGWYGDDTLDGGPNGDKMYGGEGTDSEDGGPGTDECQDHPHPAVSCNVQLTDAPDECPSEHPPESDE